MRLPRILLVLLLFGLSAPLAAAPETPEAIYGHALYYLRSGQDYERAIQQLQYLVTRFPTSRVYHLALGCADADRAASLGYAAWWTKKLADEQASYPQALKDWEAAQRDPKSDAYGDSRPDPPPQQEFVTKDDLHLFDMSIPQAVTRINGLIQSALDEWAQALTLSKTPTERAEVYYVHGWGIWLLRLLVTKDYTSDDEKLQQIHQFTDKDVFQAFTAATKIAPNNAVYWESLGDISFAKQRNDEFAALSAPEKRGPTPPDTQTLAAYQKSLALQPNNPSLWFRMYQLSNRDNQHQQEQAKTALKHVIDSEPNNALPYFLLAGILFHETHFSDPHDKPDVSIANKALTADYDPAQQQAAKEALAEIGQGFAASDCFSPKYLTPYPALLSGFDIWKNIGDFGEDSGLWFAYMRELGRAAGGYALIAAAHGDRDGLERGVQAAIRVGLKLCGDWPVKDDPSTGNNVILTLVGSAIAAIGYHDRVKGYQQLGDAASAQSAQADVDAFKEKSQDYNKAVLAELAAQTEYDSY